MPAAHEPYPIDGGPLLGAAISFWHDPSMPLTLATCLVLATNTGGTQAPELPTDEGALKPTYTLYGNLFARAEDRRVFDVDGSIADDVVRFRQVDFDMRAAITDQVDAVVILSVESDLNNTEYELELERAYLTFRGLPIFHSAPWNLGFQIGHYRTHFGYSNQVPLTDIPQITRPRSLTQFFGDDGYAQLAISMSADVPFPSAESPIHFTLEQVESGDPPFTDLDTPSGRVSGQGLRLAWKTGADDASNLLLGVSRFRGQQADEDLRRSTLVGFDALFSKTWREGGGGRGFFLGGEWIDSELERTGSPADEPSGYYVWSQLQVSDTWYVGARYDVSQELMDDTMQTETIGVFLSRVETERMRYALGIESVESDVPDLDGATRVYAELNFAFGDSIRTPFWVRR